MLLGTIMKSLSTEIAWFNEQQLRKSVRLSSCICMCATEGIIQSQHDPERMRVFLLIAVFLDQLVHSKFHSCHEDFYQAFPVPKLLAHGGCGCATPDWLIDHKHGFDTNVNWSLIKELATGALSEVLHLVQEHRDIAIDEFEAIVSDGIVDTFDQMHQDKLIQAFLLNGDRNNAEMLLNQLGG